ncbi:MAG: type II toxin-antitoxin system VapC family toxin [Chthoniobacterales bacterium]|nr:type II toxin-antitoxin system VapC family toxin [Chthoniobacterales bacterium]
MRFWDSSALLPLVIEEAGSAAMSRLFAADSEVALWWGTPTECWSAVARREREGSWPPSMTEEVLANLQKLVARAHEVLPTRAVRACSRRLLFTHSLRTADALQLAAAVVLGATEVAELEFVTLDDALALAARREGFRVISGATA